MAHVHNLRLPEPLRVSGSNIADNWERFLEQWNNYIVAADLADASSEKQAAIFLNAVGTEAYDVYRTFDFETAADRKNIDKVVDQFKKFCIGAVNVTYERYVFNRRVQYTNERFDIFLGDLRRLARSCQFAAVEDSLIRDRIVVGISNDATRHKLLQVRDLTLEKAVDICKASEAAARQLKEMTGNDEVQALASKRYDRRRESNNSTTIRKLLRCRYCNRKHDQRK